MARALWFLALLHGAAADVYLHNPRGSNNKLHEQSNTVQNDDRLFNSQNNAQGGNQAGDNCQPTCLDGNNYNRNQRGSAEGHMVYLEGTTLDIEWTAQHGCGLNPNLNCQVILQYMCAANVRNGHTTDTIDEDEDEMDNWDKGMHEDWYYYDKCQRRERNKGLFTADRNVRDDKGAQATRQNENGGRRGYECQEERDYYPYWHPTPWRDIVVLADRVEMCDYYRGESENVVGRGECVPTDPDTADPDDDLPNNPKACIGKAGYEWVERDAHGLPPPECKQPVYSRDNHLGNTKNTLPANYTWTIPQGVTGQNCVIRIRYNMSSYDYDSVKGDWELDSGSNNNDNIPYMNDNPTDDFLNYALMRSQSDAVNDQVPQGAALRISTNTNQLGRTFEDRTHVFQTRARPDGFDGYVHNLNVRGRRGNIQQVYPSVEYDFVPTILTAVRGDYLHIQFTDGDSHNNGNNGNGKTGTGKSNIVAMADDSRGTTIPASYETNPLFVTDEGEPDMEAISFFSHLNQEGCNYDDANADLQNDQQAGNCAVLNRANGLIDGGLIKVNGPEGDHGYMSSRNNDFSNRQHKGTLRILLDAAAAPGRLAGAAAETEGNIGLVVTGIVLATLTATSLLLVGSVARANPHLPWTQKAVPKKLFGVPTPPTVVPPGTLYFKLNQDFDTFDSDAFRRNVAQSIGVELENVEILSCEPGSVHIQLCFVGLDEAEAAAYAAQQNTPQFLSSRGYKVDTCNAVKAETAKPESAKAINRSWRWVKLAIFAQVALFMYGALAHRIYFQRHGNVWLPLAKGAGTVLDFLLVLLPLPTLKVMLLGSLRATPATEYIDLDKHYDFHIFIAKCVAVWAFLIHVPAHGLNIMWFFDRSCAPPRCMDASCECVPGPWGWTVGAQLRTFAGWTGVICLILFAIIFFNATPWRKGKGNKASCPLFTAEAYNGFDRFWYTHQLWIPAYLVMLLHAPKFYGWASIMLVLVAMEKAISYWRLCQLARIEAATLVSRDVMELKIHKPGFRHISGQFVKLLIPEISPFLAHPFTVSSAPVKDRFTVHIRTNDSMDWTKKLKNSLFGPAAHAPQKLTFNNYRPCELQVAVDGPFAASTQQFTNFDTVVLVGAGIGVTPFASILKAMHAGGPNLPDKVYFYWLVQDDAHFAWFSDLMHDVTDLNKSRVEITTYITGEFDLAAHTAKAAQRGGAGKQPWSAQRTGRPNWKRILGSLHKEHASGDAGTPARVGVFFCGPHALGDTLGSLCESNSSPSLKFFFNREVF
eukprot:TRINITY_DN22054_c0_g1_i1.p1 TRINITY_DN22054_c0_g1~~TRINITY_DN22054_c0_g1_i1.p1  ORF type:complete len:1267 (+),score=443.01 TRINITY_DN22054_c0_g1_i1:76-3876(+)